MTTAATWWISVEGSNLAQGDYLPKCLVPFFEPDYGTEGGIQEVPVKEYDCIILTQSCDLENDKAPLVGLCPIYPISAYEKVNPHLRQKGAWERVRQGRVEGLHLLASHDRQQSRLPRGGLWRDLQLADWVSEAARPKPWATLAASLSLS